MKPTPSVVVDARRRESWYWVENEIFTIGLGPFEGWIYSYLCRRADGEGSSFPSVATMAMDTGMSRASVQRALKDLVGKRLLGVEVRPGTSNLYRVLSPKDVHPEGVSHRGGSTGGVAVGHTTCIPQTQGVYPTDTGGVAVGGTKDYPSKDDPLKDDPLKSTAAAADAAPPVVHAHPVSQALVPVQPGGVPRGGVAAVLEHYHRLYLAKVGVKPVVHGGKDGTLAKRLVAAYGVQVVLELLAAFFASTDEWVVERSGYGFGSFYSQVNKLLVDRAAVHQPRTTLTTAKTRGNDEVVTRFIARRQAEAASDLQ